MENLSTHLRRRFKKEYINTSDDPNLRSDGRRYRKLYEDLGYDSQNGYIEAIDRIYEELFCNLGESSLARYMSSTPDENDQIEKLKKAFTEQREYYENNLKEPYFEQQKSCSHSWSDIQIAIQQYEGWASIAPQLDRGESKFGWDSFLENILNSWQENIPFIDDLISLLIDDRRTDARFMFESQRRLSISIAAEKEYYGFVKHNYKDEKIPRVKDNPYKFFYMYLRNQFVQKYLMLALPDLKKEFSGLKLKCVYEKKAIYSLHDVADIMAQMMDTDKKMYDPIKKQFQKLKYMEKFKVGGVYRFSNLAIPLSEYIYYRKKGRVRNEQLDSKGNDILIENRLAPVLRSIMDGKDEIIEEYDLVRKYFSDEYGQLFSSLNDQYQSSLFDFLSGGFCRIYYMTLGLSQELVYQDWDIARGKLD